jgi:hypothetical protein
MERSSACCAALLHLQLSEHCHKPITIPSRSHSAKLLVHGLSQAYLLSCFGARALRLARAQRKEAMGDCKSSSIRFSRFCNLAHFPACKSPSAPATSAETTNRLARSRAINFIRAFISKPSSFPMQIFVFLQDSCWRCEDRRAAVVLAPTPLGVLCAAVYFLIYGVSHLISGANLARMGKCGQYFGVHPLPICESPRKLQK